ncbi:MAG: ribosomal L7Ae/L30e/S12e/Gadd45 family protein [Prevotella sp.]|nr:ribosomal L7Ae/L30e/S12e/Gadd45 family protein [Alistipes senegalensis]MCM1357538.1 ribosomal L7Ae/L30e/S12e/Gadd45 family protein [Prevotella sp.]MCM1472890.1 ribosomal L7Ae/L30e/S12e/Gadd45 family protein [Muribaculaceae bacterium]
MNSKKTANLLTICIKAGKAVKGFDSACDAVRNGTAYCVLTASDASEKTVKETEFICNKYSVPVLKTELSKEEIVSLCGKVTAIIAICDKGFADGFVKIHT